MSRDQTVPNLNEIEQCAVKLLIT